MKITGNIFRETLNRIKPEQNKPVKDDQSEVKKQDKVSIRSSESVKTDEVRGYSPETMRTEQESESRADKIARLKEAVNKNTYNVSSEKVADKIAGSHINDII
ncbi:MAG: flagellar biosynthesis anti-sigma factor FlgM [Thermodesulfobacteriota bacterium]